MISDDFVSPFILVSNLKHSMFNHIPVTGDKSKIHSLCDSKLVQERLLGFYNLLIE